MRLKEERKLYRQGYKNIVGLDEAGRGPLAGPVVAAAVLVRVPRAKSKSQNLKFLLKETRDSKELSAKKREGIYEVLVNCPGIEWGTGRVGPGVIDRINILEATRLAMKRAIKNLKVKSPRTRTSSVRGRQKSKVDFLILDGNFEVNLPIPQKLIVKADEKIFSCAAASIIAKVTRDRAMRRYHKRFPQYGFARHKGYPTRHHLKMLKKHGPSVIHRKSFSPLKKMIK